MPKRDTAECSECHALMVWARMKPSGTLNPLDATPTNVAIGRGVVLYNPATGGAVAVSKANVDDAHRWVQEGRVEAHLSHFATCPAREKFKRH